MRLSRPFYRLPVRFDSARLQQEVLQFPAHAWTEHPNNIAGNSALRLISAGGGENDDVDGVMQPTAHLLRAPYLRQVLASLGVVFSRSRLMKLAPHSDVPEHADINYHWYYRVRIHIPIFTSPAVLFRCGDETVHMAAGEAWIFDNWRRHHVNNAGEEPRIHLVADTAGNSAFWQLVAQGQADAAPLQHRYDPNRDVQLLTERTTLAPVMAPAEIDLLLLDLRTELIATDEAAARRLPQYMGLLDAFRGDWRQLYALHGERPSGWPQYGTLRQQLREASTQIGEGLAMRTNRIGAHKVLEGRVLRAILPAVREKPAAPLPSVSASAPASVHTGSSLDRPVFIVAAPRSGSTLLFETLACSANLVTLGGEAHWLVEDLEALRPGAPGVESNRLTAAQATAAAYEHIVETIAGRLRDSHDAPVPLRPDSRLLEKTPKNALRIPFFDRLFPDALFVFLWRDPRENLSSIIEAWRSGRWKTYNGLDGFDGPWSLLLPPGWRAMNGRPLADIAAFQWSTANSIALDDLARLEPARWMSVNHAQFVADPAAHVARICRFIGIEMDARLKSRVSQPLPLSRFTQTPPDADKWRRNAGLIEPVLPTVENVWRRLQALA
jgi:hypothetical protein